MRTMLAMCTLSFSLAAYADSTKIEAPTLDATSCVKEEMKTLEIGSTSRGKKSNW